MQVLPLGSFSRIVDESDEGVRMELFYAADRFANAPRASSGAMRARSNKNMLFVWLSSQECSRADDSGSNLLQRMRGGGKFDRGMVAFMKCVVMLQVRLQHARAKATNP